MSNYNSIAQRFNPTKSNINTNLINQTLREKQNTIDQNFGIMSQQVEQVLKTDLARESDKEYLKSRVSSVLDALDNSDSIRFDSKRSAFTMQGALQDAAKDPEILKQVANTRKIRQVQAFQQERAKKGDLNQQNFNYAYQKSGIESYMNGDSDDVGNFQYLEYVDIDAKMDEAARKLKSASPNELVTIQNPLNGEIVSKKVSMVTPEEMRGYLRLQLNANDLKQLEIDGSMLYGMDDSIAVDYRDTLIEKNRIRYNNQVSKLENFKKENSSLSPSEIANIDSQIELLGAEKSTFERNLIGKKTAEAIGGQQLIEDKLNLFSKIYTKNGPESIKYDNDYIKRRRDANSESKLQAQVSDLSAITTPTNLPDGIDPYQNALNREDKTLKENGDYLKSSFANLSEGKRKVIDSTMEDIMNDPEFLAVYGGEPITDQTLQLETMNRLGANFFPPDVAKNIRSVISSTQSIQKGRERVTEEFIKAKAGEEEAFDQLYNEETALTMVTPEGEINIQQFLKSNGVNSKESYKTFVQGNSKQAKQLRATLALQSMSLTNDLSNDDYSTVSVPILGAAPIFNSGVGSTNKIDLTESEYRMMKHSAYDLSGEHLEDTYDVRKESGSYILSLKDPNTNLAKIVDRTNQLYQDGRISSIGDIVPSIFGVDTDRTIRNESSLRSMFTPDNYKEFAGKNLNYLDKSVAGSNSIRVQGALDKKVGPIYEEVFKFASSVDWDRTKPIDIYQKEDGSLFVSQKVKGRTYNQDGEVSTKEEYIQADIQANDVPNMRFFNQQINTLKKENTYSTLDQSMGEVEKLSFIGDNREQLEGLNRLYDPSNPTENMFRQMSNPKTAQKIIFNDNDMQYLRGSQAGQDIIKQFQDFTYNTQDYKLNFTKGIDSPYQVVIKNKESEEVGVIPLTNDIPVEIFEKAYLGTPQVFLSLWSQFQVKKYMNSIVSNGRR